MFQMPMSSPMMTTMLGFGCGCWAAAGAATTVSAANAANAPSRMILVMLGFLRFGCLNRAGDLRPMASIDANASLSGAIFHPQDSLTGLRPGTNFREVRAVALLAQRP